MVAVLIDPPATTTPAAAPAAIAALANPGVAIPAIPFGPGGTNDALLPMSGAATPQAEIHISFIPAATDAPRMDSLFPVPAGENQTCHVVPVGRGDPGVRDGLTLTELFLDQVFSGLQGS